MCDLQSEVKGSGFIQTAGVSGAASGEYLDTPCKYLKSWYDEVVLVDLKAGEN